MHIIQKCKTAAHTFAVYLMQTQYRGVKKWLTHDKSQEDKRLIFEIIQCIIKISNSDYHQHDDLPQLASRASSVEHQQGNKRYHKLDYQTERGPYQTP